jgi:hypothetical protein
MNTDDLNQHASGITITADELGRQAVQSLGGYIHQLYESLAAWIALEQGELLLLEITEDFAMLKEHILHRTQVKALKETSALTLNSEAAVSLINSHWSMQKANPNLVVHSTLLTTAKIGKEKKLKFPDKRSGLEYWRAAVKTQLDLKPIRTALNTIAVHGEVKKFAQESDDLLLRANLIDRIHWKFESQNLETLQDSIKDSLIYLGEVRGISSTSSEQAMNSLLGELTKRVIFTTERTLTRADLLRAFDQATRLSVPAQDYLGLVSKAMLSDSEDVGVSSAISLASQIPENPRTAARTNLLEQLHLTLANSKFLWLHGGSGLGKTSLALLYAKRDENEWLFLDLKDCESAEQVRVRLALASKQLRRQKFSGIIIDDVPIEHIARVLRNISLICFEASRRNMSLIVTSAKSPAPATMSALGRNTRDQMSVPYLIESDISEMVVKAGGDAQLWTKTIYSFCAGHPMLTDAMIQTFETRGWNPDDFAAELLKALEDRAHIGLSTESIMLRLMDELPPHARELLYRLSLVSRFDKSILVSVATAEPMLSKPMELFASLFGAWIEPRGIEIYCVSPLVSKLGAHNLTKEEQLRIHDSIVQNLIARRPFPGDFIFQLCLSSYVAKSIPGLFWFAQLVFHASTSDRAAFNNLAQYLTPMLLFRVDKGSLLFSDDKFLSFMLRVVQCLVAASTESDRAPAAFERMIDEYAKCQDQLFSITYLVGIFYTLSDRRRCLPVRIWLKMLVDLYTVQSVCNQVEGEELEHNPLLKRSAIQFLFSVQASSMSNISELQTLFDGLNDLDPDVRNFLLDGLNGPERFRRLMIDSAWLNESKSGSLDAKNASNTYGELADLSRKWGLLDLEVDCICAQIIVLDEYGENSDSAEIILNTGLQAHPNNERLLRRKQFLLYRRGSHNASLDIFLDMNETSSELDVIDKVYALRDAGISAAKLGVLEQARSLFFEGANLAAKAATKDYSNLLPIAACLFADAALCEIRIDNHRQALALLKSAFELCDRFSPKDATAQTRCYLVLDAVTASLATFVKNDKTFEPGMCSLAEADLDASHKAAPTFARLYFLSILDIRHSSDFTTIDKLRKETGKSICVGLEFLLARAILICACKTCDSQKFLHELPRYLQLINSKFFLDPSDDAETFVLQVDELKQACDLADPFIWHDFASAVITFTISCTLQEENELLLNTLQKLQEGIKEKSESSRLIAAILQDDYRPTSENSLITLVKYIKLCRSEGSQFSPDDLYLATCYFWQWITTTPLSGAVELQLSERISLVWQRTIKESLFMMSNPQKVARGVTEVLASSTAGAQRLAGLASVTRYATNRHISTDFAKLIDDYLGNVPPG